MRTLRQNLGNAISVLGTMTKLPFMKLLYPTNIFFSGIERFSPGVVVDTDRKSCIKFGHRVSIHSRCRVSARDGGEISIGENTSFNVGCIIVCRRKIKIGKNVSFGPNVLVYDHDHIMDPISGPKGDGFYLGEIEIGDNTWVGAGTIILLGTRIGRNCVIGAGSVVKGDVPDNTRLIQKRINTVKGLE